MGVPLKVLLVEDNEDDAKLLILQLTRAGFELSWLRVETKEDYLEHLDPTLDLILADYSLPTFDAPTALDLLLESHLDIPFIMVTGTMGEEAVVRVMRLGAEDYLLKDRLARLGTAVSHALEQKKFRDEKRRMEAERTRLSHEINLLLESTGEGIYGINLNGECTFINRAGAPPC